jgi:hypothetical protein
MAERLSDGRLPDYLLVSYDRPRSIVVLAEFIDGESLVLERLKARAPLSAGARRAGWVGATLGPERPRAARRRRPLVRPGGRFLVLRLPDHS